MIALALRVWGIGFGLPELFHPDEPAYVLQALAVGRGLPNGLTFADPPLFKYVLLGEFGVAYGLDRVRGLVQSPADFIEEFRANPSRLYLLARITSAGVGAVTAVATGALGSAVGGHRAGLVSGVLSACVYLLVRESHFGVNDALVTLIVTLGLLACVCRRLVVAGALTGLAFAAKYDGVALLVPVALAAKRPRGLGLAVGACLIMAVVAFPSVVTEPTRVIGDVYLHLYLSAAGGYDGLDPSGGYLFYARALGIGMGWPLVIAAIAGIAVSIRHAHWNGVVVASLPVAMLLVLGSQKLYFARFALPAVPALVVLASVALDRLIGWRTIVGLIAFAVVAVPTLADGVRFDNLLTQTDTRTLAREWVAASLPADASIAVDSPPLGPSLNGPNVRVASTALFDSSLDEYRSRGIEYVVVSSFVSESRAVDPAREQLRETFNANVQKLQLLAEFKAYTAGDEPAFAYDVIYAPWTDLDRLARPGPTIWIYRLTP